MDPVFATVVIFIVTAFSTIALVALVVGAWSIATKTVTALSQIISRWPDDRPVIGLDRGEEPHFALPAEYLLDADDHLSGSSELVRRRNS